MGNNIYFTSKLNGKRYNRGSNGLRQLKLAYNTEDFKLIFDTEFPDAPHTCVICGNETDFINFTNGYQTVCSKCKAERNHFNIDGYAEFVKEHYYEYYKDKWKSTVFVDPFDGQEYNVPNIPFSRYALIYKSKYDKNSDFWLITKKCYFCGEEYKISIFDEDDRKYTCFNHKMLNHLFPLNITFYDTVFQTVYELSNYIKSLSYEDFMILMMDYYEYIENYIKTPSFSIVNAIFRSCDTIKKNIYKDVAEYYYGNKKSTLLYFKDIPFFTYYENNKWYKNARWNNMFKTNEPLECKWCGKKIADFTNYEIIECNKKPIIIYEDRLCSFDCRNELYKVRSTYDGYINDVIKIKEKQATKLKNKISSGEFTPCIINSLTKKDISSPLYPDYKFRSSWELVFWFYNKDTIPYENYEKLRIPYTFNGVNHNYIVDFIDYVNNKVYEIKPESMCSREMNQIKFKTLKEWCLTNGYECVIISDNEIKNILLNLTNYDFLDDSCKKNISNSFKISI